LSHGRIVLLGPQRDDGSQVRDALMTLGLSGKSTVALVTAGWQGREGEDEALVQALGMPCNNLRLHARSEQLFVEDRALSTAYKARQERLRHMQVFYRTRLESADDAARHIAVRHVDPELIAEEWAVSVDAFRQLDGDHLRRCQKVFHDFEAAWRLTERPSVARVRDVLRDLIAPAEALVISGGHVGSLLNRLRLFGVLELAGDRPIVAWSAGAMVLTDRIVCFHDYPPYGKDIAQLLDAGYGLAPGVVVLPSPDGTRRRLNLDEHEGIARFSRRMAPAMCLALQPGARLDFEGGRLASWNAIHLSDGARPGATRGAA